MQTKPELMPAVEPEFALENPLEAAEDQSTRDHVFLELWHFLLERDGTGRHEYEFTTVDYNNVVARVEKRFGYSVGNKHDIKYTGDARAPLPKEMEAEGPLAWIKRGYLRVPPSTMKKGKGVKKKRTVRVGKYALVRMPHSNLITLERPEPTILEDRTPTHLLDFYADFDTDNEQSTLAIVEHNDLISRTLGVKMMRALQHDKTGVPSVGQFEVDSTWLQQDDDDRIVAPVSAKGGNDRLSFAQAYNMNCYGAERGKHRQHTYRVCSLGLVKARNGDLTIVQFSPERDVTKIRIVRTVCYRFRQPHAHLFDAAMMSS